MHKNVIKRRGTGLAKGDNGIYGDYNQQERGVYTDSQGMYHGI